MLSMVHDLKNPHMGNNMILKLGSHSLYIPALPPLFFEGTLESGRLAFLPQVSEEGRGWERVGWRSLEKPASVAWNAVRLLSSALAAAEYVECSELWKLLVST